WVSRRSRTTGRPGRPGRLLTLLCWRAVIVPNPWLLTMLLLGRLLLSPLLSSFFLSLSLFLCSLALLLSLSLFLCSLALFFRLTLRFNLEIFFVPLQH